jgi:exosortase family protein XrtM
MSRISRLRPIAVFLIAFIALQYGWERCRGSVVERFVIDHATVVPAGFWLQQLWPEQAIRAAGHSLVSPYNRLNILNGCEGLETLFLLAAAFIAYPFAWRTRLFGIVLSVLLIYTLNQLRIVLLWWAIRTDPQLFSVLHGTVLPLVLIAAGTLLFAAFLPQRSRAGS